MLGSRAGHPSGAAIGSAAQAAPWLAPHGLVSLSVLWDPSVPAEAFGLSCPSPTCPSPSPELPFTLGPLSCSTAGGSAASPGLVFCSALGFGCWAGSGPSPGSCEGLLSWQWHSGQVSCTYSHFLRQPAWKKWLHGVITAVFISWKAHKKKKTHIICNPIPLISHSCWVHQPQRRQKQLTSKCECFFISTGLHIRIHTQFTHWLHLLLYTTGIRN